MSRPDEMNTYCVPNNNNDELDCCAICSMDFDTETNLNICLTACNHKFHTSCLVELHSSNCPLCRQIIFTPKKIENRLSTYIPLVFTTPTRTELSYGELDETITPYPRLHINFDTLTN
jgi:hypothetical protein